jgi:hypothetical protein
MIGAPNVLSGGQHIPIIKPGVTNQVLRRPL